ncbi:hypothetical protein AOC36_08625 [Erysipelothrix larvae]|uniref:Bacterial repeat domain-containing protein n=1 Tax=Erysipelothrix larvae TaxID=1514105 RepID=A0A0X8H1D1_9FIRM|nr:hypothetical protein [Erysipelothrix larvae]AMC94049.1 hypothetical protein AOC36_08625 [Erysipelothrix larvae]
MKKALLIFFSFCLAFLTMQTRVSADAKNFSVISGEELIQITQNVKSDDFVYISLIQDITVDQTITIPKDVMIHLNLSGFSLMGDFEDEAMIHEMIVIEKGGQLHVNGASQNQKKGTLYSNHPFDVVIANYGTFSATESQIGLPSAFNSIILHEASDTSFFQSLLSGEIRTQQTLESHQLYINDVISDVNLFIDSKSGFTHINQSEFKKERGVPSIIDFRSGDLLITDSILQYDIPSIENPTGIISATHSGKISAPIILAFAEDTGDRSINATIKRTQIINNMGTDLIAISNQQRHTQSTINLFIHEDTVSPSRIGIYDFEGVPYASRVNVQYPVVFYNPDGPVFREYDLPKGYVFSRNPSEIPILDNTSKITFNGWQYDMDQPILEKTDIYPDVTIKQNETIVVNFLGFDYLLKAQRSIPANTEIDEAYLMDLFQLEDGEDYIFGGWNLTFSDTSDDITVTPKSTTTQLEVSFYDYYGNFITSIYVFKGNTLTQDLTPTLKDTSRYAFDGWDHDLTNIQTDLDVHPKSTDKNPTSYTLTYLDSVGNEIATYKINTNIDLDIEEIFNRHLLPDRGSLLFKGWEGFIPIKDDIILRPLYHPETFTVVFYNYNGQAFTTANYEIGSTILDENLPILEDTSRYTFKGWDSKIENISSNLEIYPIFDTKTPEEILIKFYDHQQKVAYVEKVPFGSTIDPKRLEKAYTLEDYDFYEFMGWSWTTTDTTDDILVYPEYIRPSHTLTFYDYHNNYTSQIDLYKGETLDEIILPTLKDTSRYTFKGWDIKTNDITEDMDIYPLYEEKTPTTIQIKLFDYYGKEIQRFEVPVNSEVDFETLVEPYTLNDIGNLMFTGWNLLFFDTHDDVNIWPNYAEEYVHISFEDYRGKEFHTILIFKGDSIEPHLLPTLDSDSRYTFHGWIGDFNQIMSNFRAKPDFTEVLPETITVTLRDLYQNKSITTKVPYGSTITLEDIYALYKPAPAIKGFGKIYPFVGWDGDFTDTHYDIDLYTDYGHRGDVEGFEIIESEDFEPIIPKPVRPEIPTPPKPVQPEIPTPPKPVQPEIPVHPKPVTPINPQPDKKPHTETDPVIKQALITGNAAAYLKKTPRVAYLESVFEKPLDTINISIPTLTHDILDAYIASIKKTLTNQTISNVFVVSITPQDIDQTNITSVDGVVSITLNIPDSIDPSKTIAVYHVNHDTTMTQLKSTLNQDGTLTFEATEFSHFVITNIIETQSIHTPSTQTSKTQSPSQTLPRSGVSTHYGHYVSILLGCTLLFVESKKRTKR